VYTLAARRGLQSRHLHHEQEEPYLALDGTAIVDVDDRQFKVDERDAIVVPTRAWHRVSTPDRPAHLLRRRGAADRERC
jgi:mannose-6-phosphate isomerase-like protein (cupin superfamily)